jgi:hypothetical protein
MAGNVQLQELLFGLQNSTNEKLFIDRFEVLFETDDGKTWIDVYRPRIEEPTPAEATACRAGEDIEYGRTRSLKSIVADFSPFLSYLGRCDVAAHRETNVDDLRSRVEQISKEQNVLTGLRFRKRPLFWYEVWMPSPCAGLTPKKYCATAPFMVEALDKSGSSGVCSIHV